MRAVMIANPKGRRRKNDAGDQPRGPLCQCRPKGHPLRPGSSAVCTALDGVPRSELPQVTGYFGGNQMLFNLPKNLTGSCLMRRLASRNLQAV